MTAGNSASDIARRALLWTVLCSVSAGPSFLWGQGFNTAAMITGVVLFIIAYTVGTSTPTFLRFRQKPFVRRTLYIGYGTRVLLSIAFPVGLAMDLWPGLISINVVNTLHPGAVAESEFVPTLLITIVQGTLLNAIISVYMAFVWGIQAAVCRWPGEKRGFPVELNT